MRHEKMMEYPEKVNLFRKYKAATDPVLKDRLKLEVAFQKVLEIERCFSNYDDNGERSNLNELIYFLANSLSFAGSTHVEHRAISPQ